MAIDRVWGDDDIDASCHCKCTVSCGSMAERWQYIESGVMMTLMLAVTASALCHVEAWLRDGNRVWGDDDIDTSCYCKCTMSCGSMAERWQ